MHVNNENKYEVLGGFRGRGGEMLLSAPWDRWLRKSFFADFLFS